MEQKQLAGAVLMVRPYKFRTNELTAVNNYYQNEKDNSNVEVITQSALKEFDGMVSRLQEQGVKVVVAQDEGTNDTPDSVFPNNWISFHPKHNCNLYPMFATNRRSERKIDIWVPLKKNHIDPVIMQDYSVHEEKGAYLQGTGSMVLDHKHKIAYAAICSRTDPAVFDIFCKDNGYQACAFHAYQAVEGKRELIYHTNVMLWIGEGVAAVCFDSIDDPAERKEVEGRLRKSGREIVELSEQQVANFAGNCMMLCGTKGNVLLMSRKAEQNYSQGQLEIIRKYARVVSCQIGTIERCGGGSARCMVAEIF